MSPVICANKTIEDIAPNNFDPNHEEFQRQWFSIVRYNLCPNVKGVIRPPNSMHFNRAWNIMNRVLNLEFGFCGETLEECKQSLQYDNHLPRINLFLTENENNNNQTRSYIEWRKRRYNDRKIAAAWAMMIVAFNMYAEILKTFRILPFNRIDFIGNSNTLSNYWIPHFYNRCVLLIKNDTLKNLIELFEQRRTVEFFSIIFEIYDSMHLNTDIHNSINNINRVTYQQINKLTKTIMQEYMEREDEDENIIFDNQQIANMIMQLDRPLPNDLKNIIYEICNTEITCSSQ